MALKAYSFSESEQLSAAIHDSFILEKEKLIASEFVNTHQCEVVFRSCPLCDCKDVEDFAVIEKAQYFRCKCCWSLFVPVNEGIISKYRNYTPLINFRTSKKYQETARKKRSALWNDQLFWIEFRSARFLKSLIDLSVMEIGGRYEGFSEVIKSACASYSTFTSIEEIRDTSDVILYFGVLMQEPKPKKVLSKMLKHLRKDGLLFLSTRVSTGFDMLTLKGNVGSIFPYDCSTIPSIEALEAVLNESGFEVLEISTPGTLDMRYVAENSTKLDKNDLFTRYLIEKTDDNVKSEFQRILQKCLMSSHAQLVARAIHE